jgi:hypothetical protein
MLNENYGFNSQLFICIPGADLEKTREIKLAKSAIYCG